MLDESDNELLNKYLSRISSILGGSKDAKKASLASMEELTTQNSELLQESVSIKRQLAELQKFSCLDDFTRTVLFDKLAEIVNGATVAEIKEFIDYLDIFSKYKKYGR